ncbi:MAG: TolC family protein, partial [Candidatus Marinimicrobia bacterium]|nr:TolC family protein [Candidatus Neomarinimicrobiota bacterium]
MLRILSIYLFSWLLLTSLSAQQGSALSLDDLLAIGLQGNQGIKIADRNLDAARASRQGSYSGLIPSVRASVNRDMDPKEIELAGGYRIKPKPYSSSMSVSQTLFDGATSWYNKRSGDNGVDRARAGFAKARNDALLNISQAYYRLLSALELLEVAEEAAALSRRQLELVEERYRLQAVRESDLLKARVNLGQREAAVYQNRSSVNDAATRLKLVIGVDPMGALEVQRDSVTIEAMPDKEVALRSMLTNNPDLQQQTLAAEGAWINAKAVRGVMLPSVGISYSGNALGPN